MTVKAAKSKVNTLVHNYQWFRVLFGGAIVYIVLSLVVFISHVIVAQLQAPDKYFIYTDARCKLPSGRIQAKSLEYVRTDMTADGEYVLKMRSCSQFKEPLPVVFTDRLYCESKSGGFVLVGNHREEIEQAHIGTRLESKEWIYNQDFFDGRKCYMDSEITVRPAWFVRKIQIVQSDVFTPKINDKEK